MTATTAEAILLLIAQYGVPTAQAIYGTIAKAVLEKRDPTDAEWDALVALTENTIARRLAVTPPV